MTSKEQAQQEVIQYLLDNSWEEDGQTYSKTYKIITQQSYPLPGAIVTTGGKPRFKKGDWKIGVGKITTVIYRRPKEPKTVLRTGGRRIGKQAMTFEDWECYNIPTKNFLDIKNKLEEMKVK